MHSIRRPDRTGRRLRLRGDRSHRANGKIDQIDDAPPQGIPVRIASVAPEYERVRSRLEQLSRYLGDADWLEGAFSAGDLMMVTVLRRLAGSGLLDPFPNLAAYVARGEARPAYGRAFAAQLAVFERRNDPSP